MLKMVDGSGIIGVDMVCPLGVSAPQPPNYDRVELEGTGMLVLPNSLDAPLERLELGGKTEQVQTSGKNLIDYKKIVVGLLNFVDGTFSGIYHTYFTTDFIEIESGDYVISHNSNVGIQSYALYDINNKTYVSGKAGNNKVNVLNKCLIRISFNTKPETDVSSNPIDYAKKCNIQLEKGTTATPYEQYTGGKPSPSQEYQQKIKNVGKWNEGTQKYEVEVTINSSNLFKVTEHTTGYYVDKDGKVQITKSLGYSWTAVVNNLHKQTVILHITTAINTKYRMYCTDLEDTILYKYEDSSANTNDNSHTFNMPDGAKKIYVSVLEINSAEQAEIALNLGNTALPFEPYKEQTLTLTSDRPITKWDRLVEQGGQYGWLYKHKIIEDFSTLVKDTEPIYGNDGGKYFSVSLQNASLNYDRSKIYSEVGVYGKDNKIHYIPQPMMANAIIHVSDTDTIMTAKEHMHYKVIYETTESQFVTLPQSEQSAIRALKTYYPTTVITADGGELDPDIKVTYRKEI